MPPWYLREDGDVGLGPVLVPAESRAAIEKSLADHVYGQLAEDYPKSSLDWVHHTAWEPPRVIPFSSLNMQNRKHWRASHEPDRVAAFTDRIKKRVGKGKTQLKKPAVVVFEPGRPQQGLVIDGHHRTLGAEGAGEDGVLAWAGHAREVGGPWMELHDLQFSRASGSAPGSGDDDADDQVDGRKSQPAEDDTENQVLPVSEQDVKHLFAVMCAYEALAIASGRVPTVSQLCRRHRWVEAGLLAFLLVHLHGIVKAPSSYGFASSPGSGHTRNAAHVDCAAAGAMRLLLLSLNLVLPRSTRRAEAGPFERKGLASGFRPC